MKPKVLNGYTICGYKAQLKHIEWVDCNVAEQIISPIRNCERLFSPLERRTIFSRKVFWGATSPLRPPAIPTPHAVWDQCEDEAGSCLKAAYMIMARVKSPIQDIKHWLLVPPPAVEEPTRVSYRQHLCKEIQHVLSLTISDWRRHLLVRGRTTE